MNYEKVVLKFGNGAYVAKGFKNQPYAAKITLATNFKTVEAAYNYTQEHCAFFVKHPVGMRRLNVEITEKDLLAAEITYLEEKAIEWLAKLDDALSKKGSLGKQTSSQ